MEENIIYDEELQHWGIKGQKWGVRKYQNKDGSLTPAGRKRYGSLTDAVGAVKAAHIKAKRKKQLAAARKVAAEKKAAAEQRAKDIADGKISARKMTSEELQKQIDKLNLEKRYKQLMKETSPSADTVKAGQSFAKKMWNDAIQPGLVTATKDVFGTIIKDQAKKQFGLTDNELDALNKEWSKLSVKQNISNAKKTIYDNERHLRGEDTDDESARLEKEAKDIKNRWVIEQHKNRVAKEKGFTGDENATAYEKMRTKEEAQKQVDAYNESGYGQDSVTPGPNYPKSDNVRSPISNPPAVVKSAVTSLSNVATDSAEYTNKAYRGEQVFVDTILDKDGNVIAKIKHALTGYDELYHYGIKGQKWGVRRYQNKDGSLTSKGKSRYSDKSKESDERLEQHIKDSENGKKDIYNEILKKSGNWYEGTSVTSNFKNSQNRIREANDARNKAYEEMSTYQKKVFGNKVVLNDRQEKKLSRDPEYQKLHEQYIESIHTQAKVKDDLVGVVLKELGYEDTPRGRELLRDWVIID